MNLSMFNFRSETNLDGEVFANLYENGVHYHVKFNQAFTLSIMQSMSNRNKDHMFCVVDFKSGDGSKCHTHVLK